MKYWVLAYMRYIPYPFLVASFESEEEAQKFLSESEKDLYSSTVVVYAKAAELPYPLFVRYKNGRSFVFVIDYDCYLEKEE